MAAIVFAGWLQAGFGQSLNDGLVAYYPFNGNANDESGNGNDGEVNGATLVKDRFGNSGKAYSFDGVDDNIEVPETEGFESNAHTISGWIYATSFRSEIFGKDGEDSGSRQWFIETMPDGRLTTIVWHAGGYTRNSSGSKIELNVALDNPSTIILSHSSIIEI